MSQARFKILYHGSAMLFDKIEVDKGLSRKDFGKGFYMSVSKKQAEGVMRKKYAETINRRPNRSKDGLAKVVYSITVDLSALEGLGVQWFVFKPQVVGKLVKAMEVERYD